MSLLIDSDCRGGKHQSCFGGPCECVCHDAAKAGSMSRHPSSRPARRALDEDGLSQASVSRRLRGVAPFELDEIPVVARVLGVAVTDLIQETAS